MKKEIGTNELLKGKLSNRRSGIVSFCKNKYGIVADLFLILGIIGMIISIICTNATGYVCYAFVAITVFSLCSHCIFNGKIYYVIKK